MLCQEGVRKGNPEHHLRHATTEPVDDDPLIPACAFFPPAARWVGSGWELGCDEVWGAWCGGGVVAGCKCGPTTQKRCGTVSVGAIDWVSGASQPCAVESQALTKL